MRRCATSGVPVIVLLLIGAAGAMLPGQEILSTTPPILISGARVLDAAAGAYREAPFVLVEGGRIASIGPRRPASVSDDTRVIDAKGLTLVAGLVDAHAQASPTDDLDADYFALMNLAHGVTTVRAFNVRTAWAVAQRQRIESGRVLGPRLFTSGRGIDRAARPDLWLFDAPSAEEAAGEARRQADAGVNWVAGYSHVTTDMYRAMVAAVAGTKTRIAARPGAASLAALASAGVHSIETLDYPLAGSKDPASRLGDPASKTLEARWPALPVRDATALVRALVKAHVTLVPLLAQGLVQAFPEEVAADPDLAKLPDQRRGSFAAAAARMKWPEIEPRRKDWAARISFLKRALASGVRVAAGTGFEGVGYPVPGAGIHAELAALVRAGFTPADAIRAATTNNAELLGATDQIGAVKPGMQADLILVDGDPLSSVRDLANIVHVIRSGEVLDPKALLERALKTR